MKNQLFKGLTMLALVSSFALAQAGSLSVDNVKQSLASGVHSIKQKADEAAGKVALHVSKQALSKLKEQALKAYQQALAEGSTKAEFIKALRDHAKDSKVIQMIKAKAGAKWKALPQAQRDSIKAKAKALLAKVLNKIVKHLEKSETQMH